jgi:hypothetical protein
VSNESDRVRRVIPPEAVNEMELIGNRLFSVAVSIDADSEFKAYILAAGCAHARGNRSIDNVLRRHGDEWIKKFDEDRNSLASRISKLRREIFLQAEERSIAISDLTLNPTASAGIVAAANSQIRMVSTFRAALQLIWMGYAFEAEAVIRLGYEQVAWSYGVRTLETDDEVQKTSGTRWTTKLKEVFPGAGQIYGRLSDVAHVSPATHSRFMSVSDEETTVQLKSPDTVRESLRLLLILLDAVLVVSELCFKDYGLDCENINSSTGEIFESRKVSRLMLEYADVLPGGSLSSFNDWWR